MGIVESHGTGKLHLENFTKKPRVPDSRPPQHGGMFRLCDCGHLYCGSRPLPNGKATMTFWCPACLMKKLAAVVEGFLGGDEPDDAEVVLAKYFDWCVAQDQGVNATGEET